MPRCVRPASWLWAVLVTLMVPCSHAEDMHLLEPLLSGSDVYDVIYVLECGRVVHLQAFWSGNQVSIMHTIHIAFCRKLNTFFSFSFWNYFKAIHFLTSPNPKMSAWRITATVTKKSRSLNHKLLLPVVWERLALAPREGYCVINSEAGKHPLRVHSLGSHLLRWACVRFQASLIVMTGFIETSLIYLVELFISPTS